MIRQEHDGGKTTLNTKRRVRESKTNNKDKEPNARRDTKEGKSMTTNKDEQP